MRACLNWCGAILSLSVMLAGCSRPQTPADKEGSAQKDEVSAPAGKVPGTIDHRLQQSFQEATTSEPPEGEERPPDKTVAGKVVGKMFEEIAGKDGKGGLWDQIALITPEGKRIHYLAVVKTDVGNITIDLFSDAAPNHVRNFIALAKAGYYDNLFFDRTIREELHMEGSQPSMFELLEAGCPLGTGEGGYGSIGYWLKPEISDKLVHEEGTVGASHGEELESAAAKFYINLNRAPLLDGNWTIFGKVSQGLDVARTIVTRPVTAEDSARPHEPVRIREVVIQSRTD